MYTDLSIRLTLINSERRKSGGDFFSGDVLYFYLFCCGGMMKTILKEKRADEEEVEWHTAVCLTTPWFILPWLLRPLSLNVNIKLTEHTLLSCTVTWKQMVNMKWVTFSSSGRGRIPEVAYLRSTTHKRQMCVSTNQDSTLVNVFSKLAIAHTMLFMMCFS